MQKVLEAVLISLFMGNPCLAPNDKGRARLFGLMVWAHYCLSEDPGGQQTFGFKQEAL